MLRLTILCTALILAGCATQSTPSTPSTQAAPASTPVAATPPVKAAATSSTPGAAQKAPSTVSEQGEIVGTIKPGSRFAQIKLGMTLAEVNKMIKAPDDMSRYETGKRWIPFYFGSDAQRLETYYEGEGCLTYTGGNVFGGGDNRLIKITVAATRKCME